MDRCSRLFRFRYGTIRIEKVTSLHSAVAREAPATPMFRPVIKIGSRMQFKMPPTLMPIMERKALPSERRHWFITKLADIKGAANNTYVAYSMA